MLKPKSREGRQNNALKHGAFATELLVLDEDKHEFVELHAGFVDELKPDGRMEEELVLEIAKLHWRKRRVERFFANEAEWLQADRMDEELEWVVLVNKGILKGQPCRYVWEQFLPMLPAFYHEKVTKKFECPSAEHDDAWIDRLKMFIDDLGRVTEEAIGQKRKRMRFVGETAAKLMELSAKRIAIEERLDAMIDRTLKRLAQLKTYKEVMATKEAAAPRKLSAI